MNRKGQISLMKWATRASVGVALFLVTSKLIVWVLSNSTAILASATDSGLDLLASLVTLYAVKLAVTPADEDHRFGHGKAEALAGLFQAGVMGASALFLLMESVTRFFDRQTTTSSDLVIAVSIVAILLTLMLVAFQGYVIRRTESLAVKGDHLHYKGDILLNVFVVLSAVASGAGYGWADPLLGGVIAVYIGYSSWGVAVPAIDELMDKEFSPEERETIYNMVLETRSVRGLHDLRTRRSGRMAFIQMHVEVDGALTVHEGHMIADEIEATVGEYFNDTEILIHIDPPGSQTEVLTMKELGALEN